MSSATAIGPRTPESSGPDARRVWIDIENPPQVRYLLPLKRAFESAGAEVAVTARDYGITLELLDNEGVAFHAIGASYGKRKSRKALGLLRRTRALRRFARAWRPDALIHAGRASALAARQLGIFALAICDYEYASLTVERLSRTYLAHPDVIPGSFFVEHGIAPQRLLPFRGLKEDLSFSGMDVDAIAAHPLPGLPRDGMARVLFRPPAEESHYYVSSSGLFAEAALARLSAREDVVVVFSPRYPWQIEQLGSVNWKNEPYVLRDAAPFVPLLAAVDAVVSSGGTMTREAAYLGVPAYSIYQGACGGVDRHLSSLGRLRLVTAVEELDAIEPRQRGAVDPLAANPGLPGDLVAAVNERVAAARAGRPPTRAAYGH